MYLDLKPFNQEIGKWWILCILYVFHIISHIESRDSYWEFDCFGMSPSPPTKNQEQCPSREQQVCTWKLMVGRQLSFWKGATSESQGSEQLPPKTQMNVPPKRGGVQFWKFHLPLIFMGYVSFWGCNSGSSIFFHWKKVWSWQLWGSKILGKPWRNFSTSKVSAVSQPLGGCRNLRNYYLPGSHPKNKQSSSNHPFSGANLLLVSGRVCIP